MGLEKVNEIYQGVLTCGITNLTEVTDYLNEIKESVEIDKEKKSSVFFSKE